MRKKEFTNYIEFLKFAQEKQKELKNIKFYDGRLYSFNTATTRCKYLCNVSAVTPNDFVRQLGFNNYNGFVYKCFSHLREFAPTDEEVLKWYSGYFGGLIGINWDTINDYVGDGEVNTFYDYDINKAYLHALTGWLPTKFIKTLTYFDYIHIDDIDKQNYCFFFEIKWNKYEGKFLNAIGKIKSLYQSFDFINSKQNTTMIVSALRLDLIKQIYFYDFKIVKVYQFETKRFMFYKNILNAYCEKKNELGDDFKRNALRLYGTLGQIYKKEVKKLNFEKSGLITAEYDTIINEKASPQVAMWVADSVAYKLFDIISHNLDKVISWNTDGFTSTQPIKVRLGTQGGKWKLNKIVGTPFLFDDNSCRVFYKDVNTNKIFGGDTIVDKSGYFEFYQEFKYSNLKEGYQTKKVKTKILPNIKFNRLKTFRNIVLIERLKELRKEYEQF